MMSDSLSRTDTARRLHPAWIVLRAIATLKALALPFVIFLISGGGNEDLIGFGIAGFFIVATIVVRAYEWWRLSYEVTSYGVRVRSGLFSRQERLIPFERIQSVDLREGVLERLVGVAQVRIESAAGGGGADVVLGAISRAEATALRDTLVRRRDSVLTDTPEARSAATAPMAEGELIHRLTIPELVVAGATSSRVGPAIAVLAGAFQFADELVPNRIWERLVRAAPDPTLRALIGIAVVAVLAAWVLATISTVLTFGNFELRRLDDRLLISHGLLERRRSSIPISRIQAVTVSEGWLRQPFRLAAVRVESAGYGKNAGESGILAPVIRRAHLYRLLATACPAYALELATMPLQSVPPRAARRYAMANVWVVLVLTALLTAASAFSPWTEWWWGAIPLLLAPVAAGYGLLQYHDAGWALADDRLVVRTRGVDRLTAITLRSRLQERAISQHPLQRRADLASLQIAVASGGEGGRFQLLHLDDAVASDLVDRLAPRNGSRFLDVPVTTLTTGPGDHDDSTVALRTPFLPVGHDDREDARTAIDR